LAKIAAAGNDKLNISQLLNTDRKGGASRIMLQQFWQEIGCETVCGQAKLILGRLHYVRATAEEAETEKKVCRSNHSDNRWTPSQQGRSAWFNDHTAGGYYMNNSGMDIIHLRGFEILLYLCR
jgi:hypothetical protein